MQKFPKSQTYDLRTRRNSVIFQNHQRILVNPFISQNSNENKPVVKKSIKLNLKKLPKDWFYPKKDFENLSSRQTLQTERNTDFLPLQNPSIQLYSQRKIQTDESEDLMKKTSYFGNSLQKCLRNKLHTTECKPQTIMKTQRLHSTAQFESQQPIYRLKYQKLSTQEIQKNGQIKCKKTSRLGTSQNNLQKRKSLSLPKINNRVPQLQLPLISQCKMTPTFKSVERNVSQKEIALFRSKQLVPNKNSNFRLQTGQNHCKISILSYMKSQQIEKNFEQKYTKKLQSQRKFGSIQLVNNGVKLPSLKLQSN